MFYQVAVLLLHLTLGLMLTLVIAGASGVTLEPFSLAVGTAGFASLSMGVFTALNTEQSL